MLVLAHRGKHVNAPENTIEAFEQAISAGVDGIETDVRVAVGGDLILFHDRVAANGQPVDTLTRRELSQIQGYEIPTLAEAFEEKTEILWNLEIKTRDALLPLITFLKPLYHTHKILCTSFIHPIIHDLLSELNVEGGLLIAHDPIDGFSTGAMPWDFNSRLRSIIFDFQTVSVRTIREVATRGLHTFVYNAVTVQDHQLIKSYDLYGVITDHTEFLLTER